MDLSLTPAQEMLKNAAREFLTDELPRERQRQFIEQTEAGFDRGLWDRTAELGWLGMVIPEQYGGIGGSYTDAAVLFEEMGRALLTGPYLGTGVIGALAILEGGSDAQKQDLLPKIAAGERLIALALTEPDYGWGPESIQMEAKAQGEGFVLTGAKLFVTDALGADHLLVVARTGGGASPEGGLTLFLVDADAPGVSVRGLSGWHSTKVCEIEFADVTVNRGSVIGPVGGAWPLLQPILDRAAVILSSYMVGGGQRVIDTSIEYASSRVQFGTPIGQYQRVQDHIIEAVNAVDGGRWTTYEALWKIDSGQPYEIAASVAKAAASDGFHVACHHAHEVHAAIGTSREIPLPYYTAMARTLYTYLGDPEHHRERLAGLLGL